MNYQSQSGEDAVFDPALERLFDLANATADRTAPSVNMDALIAAAFASIDAKSQARDLTESSKTATREEPTSPSANPVTQAFKRPSRLRSQLMRLIKHARPTFVLRVGTTLVLCVGCILVLMLSISYGQLQLFLFLTGMMTILGVGVLIGFGLHARSTDQRYRLLAQRVRHLNERETALDGRGYPAAICGSCPLEIHRGTLLLSERPPPVDED